MKTFQVVLFVIFFPILYIWMMHFMLGMLTMFLMNGMIAWYLYSISTYLGHAYVAAVAVTFVVMFVSDLME